jgi:hypothetical protein
MSDTDLLTLIKATPALRALADSGQDNTLAAAVPSYATTAVPAPFSAAQIMGAVSAASRKAIVSSGVYLGIQQTIAAQDRTAAAAETALCASTGLITADEATAIMAILAATVTTPDTSVTHQQASRVLAPLRARDEGGSVRAAPIDWSAA